MSGKLILDDGFEKNGIEIFYLKNEELVVIEGFYDYSNPLGRFEFPVRDLLTLLEVPVGVIRQVYNNDVFSVAKKARKKKSETKSSYVRKYKNKWITDKDLFRHHKIKPQVDLICKWCKKTFTVDVTESDRSFCSQKCTNDNWSDGVESGRFVEQAKKTRERKKEIGAKIKETRRKNKEAKLEKERIAKEQNVRMNIETGEMEPNV